MNIPLENWLSPKVVIHEGSIEGKGMFAVKPLEKDEKILVWGGDWGVDYVDYIGAQKAENEGKLTMQWDDDLYSVETRGDSEAYFLNHSCEPNTWMTDAFTIVAMKDIREGEEITADYVLWEADENYVSRWECKCGATFCRNRITGKDWRLPELQRKYKNHFSPLINKRIDKLPTA